MLELCHLILWNRNGEILGNFIRELDLKEVKEILYQMSKILLPPVRIELTTPSLQDQCSASEL